MQLALASSGNPKVLQLPLTQDGNHRIVQLVLSKRGWDVVRVVRTCATSGLEIVIRESELQHCQSQCRREEETQEYKFKTRRNKMRNQLYMRPRAPPGKARTPSSAAGTCYAISPLFLPSKTSKSIETASSQQSPAQRPPLHVLGRRTVLSAATRGAPRSIGTPPGSAVRHCTRSRGINHTNSMEFQIRGTGSTSTRSKMRSEHGPCRVTILSSTNAS